MSALYRSAAAFAAGALLLALSASPAAALHDCAFQDVNDNGVFDAGTDIVVLTANWIGKTITLANPFVVPSGCDHLYATAVGRTYVKATKIVFEGELKVFVASSSPVVLEANPDAIPGAGLGDGSVTISGKIHTGGQSGQALFPDHVVGNEAIHNRTITIIARGRTSPAAPGACAFSSALLETEYPRGSNDIGVHCNGDMVIRQSSFIAARINIQSIGGVIDARSTGAGPLISLGESCDDPAKNQAGNGNSNGVLDSADFPCTLDLGALYPGLTTFADFDALQAFCTITAGPNLFIAFNDPLIMIAGKTLDVRGFTAPGGAGDNQLTGRYRVTLAAIDGDVLMQNTQINNGEAPFPGGAVITLASRPSNGANLKDNDAEDFFGPFTGGLYNIDSACLKSGQKVRYGDLAASVVGTPDPAPCKQFPGDFTPMANIIHAP